MRGFPVEIHQRLVLDQIRNRAFTAAIREVIDSRKTAVEIGAGSGILSALLVQAGAYPVHSIEYCSATTGVAQKILRPYQYKIQMINARSYDVSLKDSPEVLVTETIGLLGPEENIVELCYDFKRRHPSIKKIVPSRLFVYAQPIWSDRVENSVREIFDSYTSAFAGTSSAKFIEEALTPELSRQVRSGDLSDSVAVGTEHLLKSYCLGVDCNSAFNQVLDLARTTQKRWNAIHLFFRVELSDSVQLSTHFSKPRTHWEHSYVWRSDEKSTRLQVQFVPGSQFVSVRWVG